MLLSIERNVGLDLGRIWAVVFRMTTLSHPLEQQYPHYICEEQSPQTHITQVIICIAEKVHLVRSNDFMMLKFSAVSGSVLEQQGHF
jgi:hypothetical protein